MRNRFVFFNPKNGAMIDESLVDVIAETLTVNFQDAGVPYCFSVHCYHCVIKYKNDQPLKQTITGGVDQYPKANIKCFTYRHKVKLLLTHKQ